MPSSWLEEADRQASRPFPARCCRTRSEAIRQHAAYLPLPALPGAGTCSGTADRAGAAQAMPSRPGPGGQPCRGGPACWLQRCWRPGGPDAGNPVANGRSCGGNQGCAGALSRRARHGPAAEATAETARRIAANVDISITAKPTLGAGDLDQLADGLVVEHRADLPAQGHGPEIGGHR